MSEQSTTPATRRGILRAGLAGATALSAGCSLFSSDGGTVTDASDSTVEPRWQFDADRWGLSPPFVASNVVCVGSKDKRLYALDAATGEAVWRYETGGPIEESPVATRDRAFVTSEDGNLYARSLETGEEEWTFESFDDPAIPPMLDGELAYLGYREATLLGLDVTSGQVDSRIQVPSLSETPVISDGVAYLAARRDGIYAIDARTGEAEWSHSMDHALDFRPVVADETVFLGGAVEQERRDSEWVISDGRVLALDRRSGEEVWAYDGEMGRPTRPVVHDRLVYVASNHRVLALDAESGETQWSKTLPERSFDANGPALVAAGTVYLAGYSRSNRTGTPRRMNTGTLFALDAETGEVEWRFDDPGNFLAPAISGDSIFVSNSNGGTVIALPL